MWPSLSLSLSPCAESFISSIAVHSPHLSSLHPTVPNIVPLLSVHHTLYIPQEIECEAGFDAGCWDSQFLSMTLYFTAATPPSASLNVWSLLLGSLKNTFFFLPSVCKHWTKGWQIKRRNQHKLQRGCFATSPRFSCSLAKIPKVFGPPQEHFSSVILLHYSEILNINFRLFVALTESYHCFAFTLNKSANQIMYAWNPTKAEYRLILYFYIKSALFLTILSITSYSFLH